MKTLLATASALTLIASTATAGFTTYRANGFLNGSAATTVQIDFTVDNDVFGFSPAKGITSFSDGIVDLSYVRTSDDFIGPDAFTLFPDFSDLSYFNRDSDIRFFAAGTGPGIIEGATVSGTFTNVIPGIGTGINASFGSTFPLGIGFNGSPTATISFDGIFGEEALLPPESESEEPLFTSSEETGPFSGGVIITSFSEVAVPEPATNAAIAIGALTGFALIRRRFAKKK